MRESLKKQVEFISELEKLKTVFRQNQTLDGDRYENSAEHSWHAALMVILFADYAPEGTDVVRSMKMILIHDVVEIDTGDTFLYDEKRREEVAKEEETAAERIFSMLPDPQNSELLALWREFEARETPDAKFAVVMDALQPLLNHPVTRRDGQNIHNVTKSQIINKKSFIKEISPDLWEVAMDAIKRCVKKGLVKDI